MSLRKKTFLIVGVILLSFIFIRHFIVRESVLKHYTDLEKKSLEMNLLRIKDILKEDLRGLHNTTSDYANWDDIYNFIKDRNQKFIKSSLNPKAFSKLKLGFVIITDTLGKPVFSLKLNNNGSRDPEMRGVKKLMEENNYLFGNSKPENGYSGFIKLDNSFLMISAMNIRTSEFHGPDRGTLLFGKYFDSEELLNFSKLIHLPIEIYYSGVENEFQRISGKNSENDTTHFYKILDENTISGYLSVKDIKNRRLFYLKSAYTREIYQQGLTAIQDFLISNTLLGVLFMVITLVMIEKLILSKLLKISSKVIEIGHKKDFSSRVSLPGKDELSKLVVSINQMLDELEQTQKEIVAKEHKYSQVVNNTKEVIFQADKNGRWTFLNPAWESLSGYTPEESMGKSTLDFILPEDRKLIIDSIKELRTGKRDFIRFEIRGIGKNNKIAWIEIFSQLNLSENGEILGTSGVITDIDARKRAEESVFQMIEDIEVRVRERTAELSKANMDLQKEIVERLHAEDKIREQAALLDITPDAIMVSDLNKKILFWNKGAEKMYGLLKEEMIGKNWLDFLSDDEKDELEMPFRVIEKEGYWIGELHHKNKEGKSIIIEARLTLIFDSFGKQKSLLIVCSDITEKVKLEVQFLRAQRMESLGTLSSGIAHDLNNVLAPILMAIEILRTQIGKEGEQWLGILDNSVKRGANLIKQILAFGRGVEGKHVPLQFKHLAKEYIKIIKETFPKSITITLDIPNNLWLISGDATQLQQLLMNLCVNAKDAMPGGGKLHISASNFMVDENYARTHVDAKTGPYVLISVSDTGTGIEQKIIDKIFEPFFTTKEMGKGTGLGLSTVFAIMKGHNGFINVYSEINNGASFNAYIPAIITEENEEIDSIPATIPHGNNELILLVDDEFSIREITGATLESYGYKVMKADNGFSALDCYKNNTNSIKVIIIDMMMPDMDGFTAITKLKEINPDVKIIANSGLIDQKKKAEEVQANEFLLKPFSADTLLKTLKSIIG